MNRRLTVSAFLVSSVLVARTALGDPSAADRATARALAREAQQALEKETYEAAADKFTRADALVHAPTLLLGLAHAQTGLGRLVEAHETYSRIIREGVASGSPRSWFKALEEATKEIEAVAPRLAWVNISVRGPTSPVVTIDGAAVPVASLEVQRPVNPGRHTIKASGEGFLAADTTMSFDEGQATAVALELEAVRQIQPSPPSMARPSSRAEPHARVEAQSVASRKTLSYVALGVGGAGLVLGGVTGALAWSKQQKLVDACPGSVCDPSQESTLNSYHTMGTLSTVGFVVGGLGAGIGLALLVTQPKAETPPRTRASARFLPFFGGGVAGVRGAF